MKKYRMNFTESFLEKFRLRNFEKNKAIQIRKIFWSKCECKCKNSVPLQGNSNVCKNCFGICGKFKDNFGDLITSYIYKKITHKNPIWSDDKNSDEPILFGCGSIVQSCKNWKNVIIWGSGLIHSKAFFDKPKMVLAVRGPLTRNRFLELGYDCPKKFGDPGLLLPRFYMPRQKKEFRIGIIPHYVDYGICKTKFTGKAFNIINVCNNVENVIDEINKCDFTISSSLHGIVVSHAYGIKSCWGKFSDLIAGDDVKFLDYYLSLNLANVKPLNFDDETINNDIDELTKLIQNFPNPSFPVKTEELMEACPFIPE